MSIYVKVDNVWKNLSGKVSVDLYAWGRNTYGQLCLGDKVSRSNPTQLSANSDYEKVNCGAHHTLIIKTNGTLLACGYNAQMQLGLGNTTDQSTPIQVGTDTDWQEVEGAGSGTYAIKTNGTLWAWGSNASGCLGINSTINSSTPTQVGYDTNWQSVSSGGAAYAMAIKTNGTLWAFGRNTYGQLGHNDTTDRSTPTQVGTDTNWQSVSCGDNHTLANKNQRYSLGLGPQHQRTTRPR
jgi:alpha-tubulin suppressor-like RCC1 family protein